MWGGIVKAILEWLTNFARSEIKQDVKASDAETEPEIRDSFRDSIRKRLRDNEGCVCEGECRCREDRAGR